MAVIFFITRTLDITNRQGKIFYPQAPQRVCFYFRFHQFSLMYLYNQEKQNKKIVKFRQMAISKGPSTYDIRWLGGQVGSRKSDKIGYRRVGRSEEIGYPIFLGNFTLFDHKIGKTTENCHKIYSSTAYILYSLCVMSGYELKRYRAKAKFVEKDQRRPRKRLQTIHE